MVHFPSRTVMVLQGDKTILYNQLDELIALCPGDWITVTDSFELDRRNTFLINPNKARNLLGSEFIHGIFDARLGFNLDAFAILAGTLKRESLFILLLPNDLLTWQDNDSLRWNEKDTPICVPNFVKHLKQVLSNLHIPIHRKLEAKKIELALSRQLTASDENKHIIQKAVDKTQKTILSEIKNSSKRINTIIGKRGRGKSTLAGLFTHYTNCIVTGPNKESLTTFFKYAKRTVSFYPPDLLVTIKLKLMPDYLIIDEAAMIPLPVLKLLLDLPIRIILITTTEGYEGTGQGFLLKLLKGKDVDYYYLTQPIRWNDEDILEKFSEKLLLSGTAESNLMERTNNKQIVYNQIAHHDVNSLISAYTLLKLAHYRTTTSDLRRMLDAENTRIWEAKLGTKLVAASIIIHEGGLADSLIESIWQCRRRPKGNLVAQSLVAHAGVKLAARLLSIRINRIAVLPSLVRQGIGFELVNRIIFYATKQKKDFISVSFSYSKEINDFWHFCGFSIIHVASSQDTMSGNYSVMAILPISQEGKKLKQILQNQLQRNWFWQKNIVNVMVNIEINNEQLFNEEDRQQLQGFVFHYRSYESSYPALCRLDIELHTKNYAATIQAFPIFLLLIVQKKTMKDTLNLLQIKGRNELIIKLRHEVKSLLQLLM